MGKVKACAKCGKMKHLAEFSWSESGARFLSVCKECVGAIPARLPGESLKTTQDAAEELKPAVKELETGEVYAPALTVNFRGHESELEWLRRAAEENFRSAEQQAVYILCQAAAGAGPARRRA